MALKEVFPNLLLIAEDEDESMQFKCYASWGIPQNLNFIHVFHVLKLESADSLLLWSMPF